MERKSPIDIAGSGNTVIDNTASGGTGAGIMVEPGAANNVIANNIVGDAGDGIVNNGATGTAITNNTVEGNCGTGIRVAGASSGVSVQNNISKNNPSPSTTCKAPADSVDIGIYDAAVNDTVVDYNTVYQTRPGAAPYGWNGAPKSLTDFRAASKQADHDLDTNEASANDDSANSAAPGYQSTDRMGNGRQDNPSVNNTGTGPVAYADRGSWEDVRAPTAKLAVTFNRTAGSITADASGSVPGWAPIASYTFDFGDGSAPVRQSTPTVTHQYAQLGVSNVTVSVTDSTSLTSAASWSGCVGGPVVPGSGAQRLTADFNGDGRDDVAMFYDYGGGHVGLFTMSNHGCGNFDAPVLRWSGPNWGTGTRFMTVGDFNGDGKADIALFYDYGGGHVAVFTLPASGGGGFSAPTLRWNGQYWGGGTKLMTAGDFNGDGKADIALFYDYGGGHVAVFTLPASGGGGFSAPTLRWNGQYWGGGTKLMTAGDFNGDGKADIALFYDYGGGHVAVFTLPASGGGGLSAPVLRWNAPRWGGGTVAMAAGNYTSDTKSDIALFYTYTRWNIGVFNLVASRSGDGSFTAPTQLWAGDWANSASQNDKFMVAGSFTGAGRDGIVLFRDDSWSTDAQLYTLNPDAANGYSAPVLSWDGPYWGNRTQAIG
nr:FG-GAP-like repeat-containing protein [Planosporangium thailandense]